MRFITAAAGALLVAAANATPAPQGDYVSIYAATIQYNNTGGADSFAMQLFGSEFANGDDGYCYDNQVEWPNPVDTTTCSDDSFAYAVHPGVDKEHLRIRIYHELSPGKGSWGQGFMNLTCHGDGDNTCDMQGPGNVLINLVDDGGPSDSDWP